MRVFQWLSIFFFLVLLGVGCQGERQSKDLSGRLGSQQTAIIYGVDDRKDAIEHPDAKLRQLSAAVGALIRSSRIKIDGRTGDVTLASTTLNEKTKASSSYKGKEMCQNEPFRDDPAPASCSVFLIGPRLMATAGHCISTRPPLSPQAATAWCNSRFVVFGFAKNKNGQVPKLTQDNVYRCSRVLLHKLTRTAPVVDIGVFELDREVKGIKPLDVEWKVTLKKDEPLAVMGFPSGIPLKIAAGGKVTNERTKQGDYFITNLDTLPGNSGSPVFSTQSYKVVGVHVRGRRPVYIIDPKEDCVKSNVVPQNPGKQAATYMIHGQVEKCKSDKDCKGGLVCQQDLCSPAQADLVITKLEVTTSSLVLGLPINVQVVVKNQGRLDIPDSFRVGLWRSRNGIICPSCGDDKLLGTLQVTTGLKAGESYTGTFGFKAVVPITAGKQYLGAYADDFVGDAASRFGKVRESSEGNNYRSTQVEIQKCLSECKQTGAARCVGQRIDVCEKDAQGCLVWSLEQFCKTPSVCQKGKCIKTCQDTCPFEDDKKCEGLDVMVCKVQASGCRAWETIQTCKKEEETCTKSVCVPIPKKDNGKACEKDNDCKSGKCVSKGGKKTCVQGCEAQGDCSSLTATPFCLNGFCQALPKGSCLTIRDCAKSEICSSHKCLPDPKKVGCGCDVNATPHTPRDIGWLLVLLFGLFGLRRKKRGLASLRNVCKL